MRWFLIHRVQVSAIHRGLEVHPTTDWPGTFGGSMPGFQNRLSVALGDDPSSVSSSEIPGGASEERFQAERCEVSLANLTRYSTGLPKINGPHRRAEVWAAGTSSRPIAVDEPGSQLPDHADNAWRLVPPQGSFPATRKSNCR